MNTKQVVEILTLMSKKMEEQKDFLTELDNRIADGDHGINMARGFSAVEQKSSDFADKDIGTVLKTTGMALVSAIGGSAGPLYGTAFMKSGMVLSGENEIDIDGFISCMQTAIDGIMQRGKAVYGEKTMLDAMIPSVQAMKSAKEDGLCEKEILQAGVKSAWEGVEYTKTIPATKGRASYIGERSIGHQDPGATSFAYLLEVVSDYI